MKKARRSAKTPKPRTNPDYAFIIVVGLLTIFGLVMLTSASSDLAKAKFGDSYHYLRHQLLYGLSFGIAGFLACSFIYYGRLRKWAPLFLALTVAALLIVFSPFGVTAKGAARWIDVGVGSFQPAEFAKLSFILYIAAWLGKNSSSRTKTFIEGLLPFILITGVVSFLIFIQPATTTAVIILAGALATYFAAGARMSFVPITLVLGIAAVALLIYVTPYRLERVTTFLNPAANTLDESYQQTQAKQALGSGGVTGVGYGQSTTKLNYLPEPVGDSIFAVIGEELGFVGTSLVVLAFLTLIFRGLAIARSAPDAFGKAVTVGFTTIIGFQAFIHMAAISGLIPLTGVPLPFVSFGGTALATFLTMSGIIVNVSKYRRK